MAITKTEGLASIEQLVAWMQTNLVPNFFQSVEIDSEDNTLIVCTGVGGQKLLGIQMQSESLFNPINCILYKSDGTSETISQPVSTIFYAVFRYAAVCSHGALIAFSRYNDNTSSANSSSHILITKNNLDKTAVVVTSGKYGDGVKGHDIKTTNLYPMAEGDSTVISTLTFTPRTMEQAQFVQFATNPVYNAISYTPDAYYMQCGNFYSEVFNTITSGGVDYMTNGYWAIKDE